MSKINYYIKRIWTAIRHWRGHLMLWKIRFSIVLECLTSKNYDKRKLVYMLLSSREIPFLPYKFTDKYDVNNVVVQRDKEGFPYILHNGKRMFLKKNWDENKCKKYYISLLCELDMESPHSYFASKKVDFSKDDVVADLGAAEGIFSLDIIEKVEKVYMFECDPEWKEPLKRTFEKWNDRIEIVEKFIGSICDESSITLDCFFKGKKVTCIKADIEGAEENMLIGGEETFLKKVKKALICTYHLPNAELSIQTYLNKYGFDTEFNEGYVLFVYNLKTFKSPYIRHALILGHK